MNLQEVMNGVKHLPDTVDAVIIGAGFAGLFMLHELRERGYSTKVFEAGDGIGGTWHWNRYPGARCDIESMQYSYSFSDELQQQWHWSERFAKQPEILCYLNHVADKFDLRKDIQLETRVTSIIYDEDLSQWTIATNRNDRISAKFCILATGCLSIPRDPKMKGLDQFKGNVYSTSNWPKDDISFVNRRVAVIGTGSSGAQCIPIIANEATHLYVFQRTPNFIIPSDNKSFDTEYEEDWKSKYNQRRRQMLETSAGIFSDCDNDSSTVNMTDNERFEAAWKKGGFLFFTTFQGRLNDKAISEIISSFIHGKIREIVKDPTVAEALSPHDHLFGTKRPCFVSQYYETFNRDNVTLVDIHNKNIDEITTTGIQIEDKYYEVDDIVLAIGFDAITGSMLNIDIRGRSGKTLQEKWAIRPRALLGMMIVGFPNLFTIAGPGSPIDLTNMIPHIEENVKWIIKCIEHLKIHNIDSIEPTVDAQNAWVDHVDMVANQILCSTGNFQHNDSNIREKSSAFMRYAGGLHNYLKMCEKVAMHGYKQFFVLK
jgi:cation diffusion facilitator CzcD-associated flavoprotein CzcO